MKYIILNVKQIYASREKKLQSAFMITIILNETMKRLHEYNRKLRFCEMSLLIRL